MKAVAIIPARIGSTRMPRKMLREIAGEPLVGRVYKAVSMSPLLEQVIVATDSEEIVEVCRQNGWRCQMTSPRHSSGTERVHEVAQSVPADVYVNVQGDEPLTRPDHIRALLAVMEDPKVQVGTLRTVAAPEDVDNPGAVKVVSDSHGRVLYFSRATIPYDRDGGGIHVFKHLGFYAYRKPALDAFVRWPQSPLEVVERLEQLRFLENGIDIYVGETPYDTIGIDTEDDVRRLERLLTAKKAD